jgi:hypothetical protein
VGVNLRVGREVKERLDVAVKVKTKSEHEAEIRPESLIREAGIHRQILNRRVLP